MATQDIIFAGFGGQGILSMGKFLAYAGMDANLNVSWLPSYGPEMRGGTANCSVIISDEPVGSPIVSKASSVVVMNRPSLDKFEDKIKKGGLLIIDCDLINRDIERNDIEVIKIPAQTIAEEMGNKKIANMVLLGALVAKTGVVSMGTVLQALKDHGKAQFFEVNKLALEKGAEYAK
ncbi:MAG: 2-oxoacid:acceptor oxidoreductase family protein [Bacillota bacterium]|nr:2-oxoacid:acceptor oxidoreductase family protein [Bacillota bacterium]